ncbi:uncharacterized protein [Eurosta solidaginis]|uniref:uncharacterized protein n=1 Tax=Eurosta solidaginis TaxID=178769 RepID=UPI0035310569
MADLPENLQVIKPEGSQLPETEVQPRRLIKERLNLHVKRRLHQNQDQQQEPQQIAPPITHPSMNTQRIREAVEIVANTQQLAKINVNSIGNNVTAPQSTSKRKEKQQQREQVKTRKPYQKRTDKKDTKSQMQITGGEDSGRARKNKCQKQPVPVVGTAVQVTVGNAGSNSGALSLSPAVEEGSCGGGGDETDGRDTYMRDKEKCPDILGMVLSAKKRAVMQNPEVQEFLGKVMAAFKN